MDCCRAWESHADPEINRTRNPTTDTLYPTFTFGGTESNYDITKVAVDADPKSDQNKLMDVIRRTLANTESPTSGTGDLRDTRTVATDVEGVSTEEARTDV